MWPLNKRQRIRKNVLQILTEIDLHYDYGDFLGIEAVNQFREMGNERRAESIRDLTPDCYSVLMPALVKSPVVFEEILRRSPSKEELTDLQRAANFVLLRMGSEAVLKLLEATYSRQSNIKRLGNDPVTETLCRFGEYAFPETVVFLFEIAKSKQIEPSAEANQIEACLEAVRSTGAQGVRALCAIGDAKQWACLGRLLRKLAASSDFHPVLSQVLAERLPSWFKTARSVREVFEMLDEVGSAAAYCVRRIAVEAACLPTQCFETTENATGVADVLYGCAMDRLMSWKQVDKNLALMLMERFIFDDDRRVVCVFDEVSLETRQQAVELFNAKHARRVLNHAAGEFGRAYGLLKCDGLIKLLNVGNDVSAALKDCVDQQWESDFAPIRSQRERYGVEVFTLKYRGCVFDDAILTRLSSVLHTPGLADAIQRDRNLGVQNLPRTELT